MDEKIKNIYEPITADEDAVERAVRAAQTQRTRRLSAGKIAGIAAAAVLVTALSAAGATLFSRALMPASSSDTAAQSIDVYGYAGEDALADEDAPADSGDGSQSGESGSGYSAAESKGRRTAVDDDTLYIVSFSEDEEGIELRFFVSDLDFDTDAVAARVEDENGNEPELKAEEKTEETGGVVITQRYRPAGGDAVRVILYDKNSGETLREYEMGAKGESVLMNNEE